MATNEICAMRRWTDEEEDDFLIVARELSLVEQTDSKAKRNKVVMNQAVEAMRSRGHEFDM